MQFSKFLVGKRPFCIWSDDLDEANRVLLRSLDADYFTFQGRQLARSLETDDAQRAAVALRSAYSHALETFFALLFAAIQAPDCVPAWLALYQPAELVALVDMVQRYDMPKSKLRIAKKDWDVRWSGIAATLMPVGGEFQDASQAIRRGFGRMWTFFANDFLNAQKRSEYNWIKHGMRVAPGGFVLRMGEEPALGVAPPEEAMHTIGRSKYGCTSFVPEAIANAPLQLRYRMTSSNWNPNSHIAGLNALSVSVANLLVFLNAYNDYSDAGEMTVPQDDAFYSSPWQSGVGVTTSSHALEIRNSDVKIFTAEEILAEYEQEPELPPNSR